MSMIQAGIYYNIKKKINNDFRSIKKEDIDFIFYYVDSLKKQINEIDKTKNDVTYKYENMIQAFECDFNLPFNYGDFTMFDDLKRLIESKNERLSKDIELLQELSFGVRYGNLKIVEVK